MKKTMKFLSMLFMTTFFCVNFCACSDDEDAAAIDTSLIGSWEESSYGETFVFTFGKDGKFVMTYIYEGEAEEEGAGTYTTANNILSCKIKWEEDGESGIEILRYKYAVDGNTLYLYEEIEDDDDTPTGEFDDEPWVFKKR